MTKLRLTALALVVLLVAALTGTAGAADPDDPRAERDESRRKQAALAADLDVLEASEAQLDAAAEALAADVRAQTSEVEASRQAVDAAVAEIARAERALTASRTEVERLTGELVDKAVSNFIVPERASLYDVAVSADFSEAARKQVFIEQVVADEAALVDELAATREDMEVQEQAARTAEARATQRRAETERRLADLETAAAEHARVQAAVADRQAAVVAEIDALSRHEAELTDLIAQREREQRAREARERAEAEALRLREADRQRAEQGLRDRAAREAARDRARTTTTTAPAKRPPATGGQPSRPQPAPSSDTRTGSGGCIWPTRGTVTSEYGNRWGRLHAGIDISAPIGTPIYAAKAGTVLVAGSQSGYGTTIVLDHGEMTTVYAHQSSMAVARGASVSQGQLIGYVGNTGQSTGPHLHFETRYDGTPRNPRSCLP